MPQHRVSDIKVGIIGAGLMGRWHAHAANQLGARIVAIADQNPTVARSLGKRCQKASLYPDITQLLETAEIDALHICTPLASHAELVTYALDSGAHVLIEKPITPTATETVELLQLAEQQEVILCPVHQFAFQRGVTNVLRSLDELGEVFRVSFRTHSAGAEGMDQKEADEVIADILPHPLSVLQKLFPGCLARASDWRTLKTYSGELQLTGNIDGMGINIDISMNARPTRCEMDIACSRGRIYLNFFHGYSLIEKGAVSRWQKLVQPLSYSSREWAVSAGNLMLRLIKNEPAYPGLRTLIREFYQSIQEGAESPVPPDDIRILAELRDRLIER
ncbi:MAG: Gfo/Idh/MocA family oxidoreductase [Gammaproteobacteria bacterium]|nr:Gfo/Idh/MocA family oxidoreductase [Gammaproteobacteria bacterium]